MKKSVKIILILLSSVFLIISGFFVYGFILTKDVNLDENKLINLERTVTFYDKNNVEFYLESGGKQIAKECDINDTTKNAFISIEDKRFYQHNGIDKKGLLRAMMNNIKSFSFKEGASTISQQLIKNTHFSNKKTLKRKLSEIKLARQLEKNFTKNEILTKYLNTIYFGENCYGIVKASNHYFNKDPIDLDLNESCALAGMIKAPSTYSPKNNFEKFNNRKNIVLTKMFEQNFISKEEFDKNTNKSVEICAENNKNNKCYDYSYLAQKEADKILEVTPYYENHIKVYTHFDCQKQKILEKHLSEITDYNNSAIIINKCGEIEAYYSTKGDIKRQVGSVIKPILVYGPAIEENIISEMTPICDEKTDFNGYSPCNYNNKYYGYISSKECLAKSSNVGAVKIFNSTGIEKSKSYAKKAGLNYCEKDNSLSLALGSSENGFSLKEITGSYELFINDGYYITPHCINKINDENDNLIYENIPTKNKVLSDDTVGIMNDILSYTVTNGTAKKLSFLKFPVYSKTGTVGNENGNTDANNISYNDENIIGISIFNKENCLMPNNITGGSLPTIISKNIWSEIYKDKTPPEKIENPKNITEIYLDKISYENDHQEILADEICPLRYRIKGLEKTQNINKYEMSKRFSYPVIEQPILSVNYNSISILLCHTEYCKIKVYRISEDNKTLIFDSNNSNENTIIDNEILPDKIYSYSFVPYNIFEGKEYIGKEIFSDKIKSPKTSLDDNWWEGDFE